MFLATYEGKINLQVKCIIDDYLKSNRKHIFQCVPIKTFTMTTLR